MSRRVFGDARRSRLDRMQLSGEFDSDSGQNYGALVYIASVVLDLFFSSSVVADPNNDRVEDSSRTLPGKDRRGWRAK